MADTPIWFVPEQARRLTPNRYHAGYRPDFVRALQVLVLHYTVGYTAEGAARWLCNPDAKASAHFVVGHQGQVLQLAPLNERTWHAGGRSSRWRGLHVNPRSIGIEIANLGPLRVQGGKVVDAWKREFRGEVFEADDGSLWQRFEDEQVEAVNRLIVMSCSAFPQLLASDAGDGQLPRIVDHQAVDPSRKIDVGPAWPWERTVSVLEDGFGAPAVADLRDHLFGRGRLA